MNLKPHELADLIASYARGIAQRAPGSMFERDNNLDDPRQPRKADLKATIERMLQLVNELP